MKEMWKRELNRTYLILNSEGTEYEESYEIEMIIKNQPKGILPMRVLRMDGKIRLYYEVSAKQTLKDCAQRNKLSFENIRNLFEAIEWLTKEVKNYLLDMESVMLDMEHIYIQENTFYFCYCPWEKKEVLVSLREMLEEILRDVDYQDTQGVELSYHLYQRACKGDFCIAEILEKHCKCEMLEDTETDGSYLEEQEPYIEQDMREISKMQDESKERYQGFLGRVLKFFLKKEKVKKEDELKCYNTDWTSGKGNICAIAEEMHYAEREAKLETNTMLLSNISATQWRLRPLLTEYEEFVVSEECFFVGKKKESVDGYIERDTVSRIHSKLRVENGVLYISDVNSTNGTFVNGEVIQPGIEMEIYAGDRIMFADVEYECYNSF